jgi:hypothetical protein
MSVAAGEFLALAVVIALVVVNVFAVVEVFRTARSCFGRRVSRRPARPSARPPSKAAPTAQALPGGYCDACGATAFGAHQDIERFAAKHVCNGAMVTGETPSATTPHPPK